MTRSTLHCPDSKQNKGSQDSVERYSTRHESQETKQVKTRTNKPELVSCQACYYPPSLDFVLLLLLKASLFRRQMTFCRRCGRKSRANSTWNQLESADTCYPYVAVFHVSVYPLPKRKVTRTLNDRQHNHIQHPRRHSLPLIPVLALAATNANAPILLS